MARQRSPDRLKAEQMYLEHKGNIDLVDIANELDRPSGTVRGWKNKDKWDKKLSGTFQKKSDKNTERSKKKKATKIIKEVVKDIDREIVEEVIKNENLTDKQQLFCIYYSKCYNATKAYQKAYKSSYLVANSEGYKLLVNPCIKAQIEKLKRNKLNRAMLSEDDLFQVMMDIAFADITDYVEFGTEELPELNIVTGEQAIDKEGNPLFYTRNYVNFKNGTEVDGTLLSEVKQGKDGVSVKLQDKMKALQWLSDRMDLLPLIAKEKLQLEKDKLEHLKGKDNQTDKPIEIVIKNKDD